MAQTIFPLVNTTFLGNLLLHVFIFIVFLLKFEEIGTLLNMKIGYNLIGKLPVFLVKGGNKILFQEIPHLRDLQLRKFTCL